MVPGSYELDLQLRLVRSRGWGVVTNEDFHEVYNRLRADPAFDSSFWQCCDLRQVTQITASVETVRGLAESHLFAPGSRRAFVVGREVDFGLARLFQTYSEFEGGTVEVFRSMAEAEAWLGLAQTL